MHIVGVVPPGRYFALTTPIEYFEHSSGREGPFLSVHTRDDLE